MIRPAKVFDLDAYLQRIGLSGRPGLSDVHLAHVTSIPFENLDPHRGVPVSLTVEDLQDKLVPAVVAPERVIRATRLLARAAQVLWIPVVATTQYEKGLGPIVTAVAELLPKDVVRLDKTAFSCFDDPRFDRLVREAAPRARTLIVAGIEAHICVGVRPLSAIRASSVVSGPWSSSWSTQAAVVESAERHQGKLAVRREEYPPGLAQGPQHAPVAVELDDLGALAGG